MTRYTLIALACLACTAPTKPAGSVAAAVESAPTSRRPHTTPPRVIYREHVPVCPSDARPIREPKRRVIDTWDLDGVWTVALKVDYSTCQDLLDGDLKQRTWTIESSGFDLTMRVAGTDDNEPTVYTADFLSGIFPSRKYRDAASLRTQVASAASITEVLFTGRAGRTHGNSGIQLWSIEPDHLRGRRAVGRDDCTVIYDIAAVRN